MPIEFDDPEDDESVAPPPAPPPPAPAPPAPRPVVRNEIVVPAPVVNNEIVVKPADVLVRVIKEEIRPAPWDELSFRPEYFPDGRIKELRVKRIK